MSDSQEAGGGPAEEDSGTGDAVDADEQEPTPTDAVEDDPDDAEHAPESAAAPSPPPAEAEEPGVSSAPVEDGPDDEASREPESADAPASPHMDPDEEHQLQGAGDHEMEPLNPRPPTAPKVAQQGQGPRDRSIALADTATEVPDVAVAPVVGAAVGAVAASASSAVNDKLGDLPASLREPLLAALKEAEAAGALSGGTLRGTAGDTLVSAVNAAVGEEIRSILAMIPLADEQQKSALVQVFQLSMPMVEQLLHGGAAAFLGGLGSSITASAARAEDWLEQNWAVLLKMVVAVLLRKVKVTKPRVVGIVFDFLDDMSADPEIKALMQDLVKRPSMQRLASIIEYTFTTAVHLGGRKMHEKMEEWAGKLESVIASAALGGLAAWKVQLKAADEKAIISAVKLSISPQQIHLALGGDVIGLFAGGKSPLAGEHMKKLLFSVAKQLIAELIHRKLGPQKQSVLEIFEVIEKQLDDVPQPAEEHDKPDIVAVLVGVLDAPREQMPAVLFARLKELFEGLQDVNIADFGKKLLKSLSVKIEPETPFAPLHQAVYNFLRRMGVTRETAERFANKVTGAGCTGGAGLDFATLLTGMGGEWSTTLSTVQDFCGPELAAVVSEIIAGKLAKRFSPMPLEDITQLLQQLGVGKGSVFFEKGPQLMLNPDPEYVLDALAEVIGQLEEKAVAKLLPIANGALVTSARKMLLKGGVNEAAAGSMSSHLESALTPEAIAHFFSGDIGAGISAVITNLRHDDDSGFAAIHDALLDEAVAVGSVLISAVFKIPQKHQHLIRKVLEHLGFEENKEELINAVLDPEALVGVLSSRLGAAVQDQVEGLEDLLKELLQGMVASRLMADPLSLSEAYAADTATELLAAFSLSGFDVESPMDSIFNIMKELGGKILPLIEFLAVRILTKKLHFKPDLAASFIGELLNPTAMTVPHFDMDFEGALEQAQRGGVVGLEAQANAMAEAQQAAMAKVQAKAEASIASAQVTMSNQAVEALNTLAAGQDIVIGDAFKCLSAPVIDFVRLLGSETTDMQPPLEAYRAFKSICDAGLLTCLEQFDLFERLKIDMSTETFQLVTTKASLSKIAGVAIQMEELKAELACLEQEPFDLRKHAERQRQDLLDAKGGKNATQAQLNVKVATKKSIGDQFTLDLKDMMEKKKQTIKRQAKLPGGEPHKGQQCTTPMQAEIIKACGGGPDADAISTNLTVKQLLIIKRLHELGTDDTSFASVEVTLFAGLGEDIADMTTDELKKFGKVVEQLVGLSSESFINMIKLPKAVMQRLRQLHTSHKTATALASALATGPPAYQASDRMDSFAAAKQLADRRAEASRALGDPSVNDAQAVQQIDTAVQQHVAKQRCMSALSTVEELMELSKLGDRAGGFLEFVAKMPPVSQTELDAFKRLTTEDLLGKLGAFELKVKAKEAELKAKMVEDLKSLGDDQRAVFEAEAVALVADSVASFRDTMSSQPVESTGVSDVIPLLINALNNPEEILASICEIIEVLGENEAGVPDPIPIPGSPTLTQLVFIPPPLTKEQLISVLRAMKGDGIPSLLEFFGAPIYEAMLQLGMDTLGEIVMPELPELTMPTVGLDWIKKLGLPPNVFDALKNLGAETMAKLKEMDPLELAMELFQWLQNAGCDPPGVDELLEMAQKIIMMAVEAGMEAVTTLVEMGSEAFEAVSAAADALGDDALGFITDQADLVNMDSIMSMEDEEGGGKLTSVTLFEELQIQVRAPQIKNPMKKEWVKCRVVGMNCVTKTARTDLVQEGVFTVTNDGAAKLQELEKELEALDKEQLETQAALNEAYEEKLHSKITKLTKLVQAIKADKRRLNEKLIPLKKEAQFPLESCTFNVIAFPELYRDYKLCEARIGLTHKKDKKKKVNEVEELKKASKQRWTSNVALGGSTIVAAIENAAADETGDVEAGENTTLNLADRIAGGGGADVETESLLPVSPGGSKFAPLPGSVPSPEQGLSSPRVETPPLDDDDEVAADDKLNPSSSYWKTADGKWSGRKIRTDDDPRNPTDKKPLTSKEYLKKYGSSEMKRAEIVKLIKGQDKGLLTVELISGGTKLGRGNPDDPILQYDPILKLREQVLAKNKNRAAFASQAKRAEFSIDKMNARAAKRGNDINLTGDEQAEVDKLEATKKEAKSSESSVDAELATLKKQLSKKQRRLDDLQTWGADSIELDNLSLNASSAEYAAQARDVNQNFNLLQPVQGQLGAQELTEEEKELLKELAPEELAARHPSIKNKIDSFGRWQALDSKIEALEQKTEGVVKAELLARADEVNYRENFPHNDPILSAKTGRPQTWSAEDQKRLPSSWKKLNGKIRDYAEFDDGVSEFGKSKDAKIDLNEDFDYRKTTWKAFFVINLTMLTKVANGLFFLGQKLTMGQCCRKKPFPKGAGSSDPTPGGGKLFLQFKKEVGEHGELVAYDSDPKKYYHPKGTPKLPFCCFIPVWRCLCPKAAARPMADHYPYGVKGQLLNNSLRGVAPAGLRKETIKMWISKPIRWVVKPLNEAALLFAWYLLYLAVLGSINEEEACMQGAYDARPMMAANASVQPEAPWDTSNFSYHTEKDICDVWLPPATSEEMDNANRTRLYGNAGAGVPPSYGLPDKSMDPIGVDFDIIGMGLKKQCDGTSMFSVAQMDGALCGALPKCYDPEFWLLPLKERFLFNPIPFPGTGPVGGGGKCMTQYVDMVFAIMDRVQALADAASLDDEAAGNTTNSTSRRLEGVVNRGGGESAQRTVFTARDILAEAVGLPLGLLGAFLHMGTGKNPFLQLMDEFSELRNAPQSISQRAARRQLSSAADPDHDAMREYAHQVRLRSALRFDNTSYTGEVKPISFADIVGNATTGNLSADEIDAYTFTLMDYWRNDMYCSDKSGTISLKFENHTHSDFKWVDNRGFLDYITETEVGLTLDKGVCGEWCQQKFMASMILAALLFYGFLLAVIAWIFKWCLPPGGLGKMGYFIQIMSIAGPFGMAFVLAGENTEAINSIVRYTKETGGLRMWTNPANASAFVNGTLVYSNLSGATGASPDYAVDSNGTSGLHYDMTRLAPLNDTCRNHAFNYTSSAGFAQLSIFFIILAIVFFAILLPCKVANTFFGEGLMVNKKESSAQKQKREAKNLKLGEKGKPPILQKKTKKKGVPCFYWWNKFFGFVVKFCCGMALLLFFLMAIAALLSKFTMPGGLDFCGLGFCDIQMPSIAAFKFNPGIILSLSVLSYLLRAILTLIDIALNTGFDSVIKEIIDTIMFILKNITCQPLINFICKDRDMETGIDGFDEFTLAGFGESTKYVMILKKLQAATESGWDKKQTDEVTLLLKCFITDTGELQQIMRALKAAKKGDVTGLKSIQNLKPFSDAHVSEKPLKKSDPDGMKKWDCPCGSGKKVFTCFFETAKSKYDWKTMAKKLAKGGEAQGAGGGSGSTLSFTDRKDKLKAATQEMLSEKHTVLAKIKDQFNDPKLATEYISLGDTFKETILGLEAELEGPKGAGFPMEVLIAHASNAFDAKLASTEKALQDLVKVEKKLFESDDVTQDMYDQAMADLDQVTGLDPMLIAFQMQLAASFGCPLYKMFYMLKKTTFKLKYNLKRGGIAIPDKIPVIGGKRLCGKKPEGAPPGKVSQAITFVKEMFFGCAKACMSILKNKFSSKKKPTVSSPRAEFGEMLDFYRLKQYNKTYNDKLSLWDFKKKQAQGLPGRLPLVSDVTNRRWVLDCCDMCGIEIASGDMTELLKSFKPAHNAK